MQILSRIDNPAMLKKMSVPQLDKLAGEIRQLMINVTAANGGHLASSLGAVELTLALFSVFDIPKDKIIWDVGHQAYAHKILTGRRDNFATLRKKDGVAPFPRREESTADAFGTGHASTSVSAAVGFAVARDLAQEKHHVIAVIGDGALTGGEAFEALNHAGGLKKRLIVVLNDNEMSIAKNVGALSGYLNRLQLSLQYGRAKKDAVGLIKNLPYLGEKALKTAAEIKEGTKSLISLGGLFDEWGFKTIGPVDGHDIALLKEVFNDAKNMNCPVLIHVQTKKGKGYRPAQNSPELFHGIGKFDATTGLPAKKSGGKTYTDIFGATLVELAQTNKDIVAITAAMPGGTGLKKFAETFPKRFFDVGIAEEHAMTFAAALAAAGKRPVIALYSTFAQRAYDQILHDVCLQHLPVVLALDRAGLVGEDGATHHGVFDLSYLRHIPGITVMCPKDENELRNMLFTALNAAEPTAIRYPRGAGLGVPLDQDLQNLPRGKGEVLRDGTDAAFLAVGSMVAPALKAAEILQEDGISAAVVNMRFVKPLDTEMITHFATTAKLLVTVEENVLAGGFGSAVSEFLCDRRLFPVPVLRIGIPDKFIPHGSRDELLADCGLTAPQIAATVKEALDGKITS